jgi:hypothetical protein
MIPDYEKGDYVKALEIVPELVLTESDPMRFLRYTKFNVAAAAQSLVLYWKRRREVFGDRAFLPLTLTGDSALSNDDIDCIKTGSVVILPNDAEGRAVMCFDLSRRIDHSLERRLRCAFYCGQVISENEVSQTDGFALLVITNDGRMIDPAMTHCRNVLLYTFPVKLKAIHLVKCMSKWANNCLAQAFLSGMLKVFGHLVQGCQVYCHASQVREKIVQSLESHGMSRRGLPRRVGGSWSYERFSDWLIERVRMDREGQPEKSVPATQTASGVAAALLTSTSTSDDNDCKPRSTEHSGDARLDNAPAVAFRAGGATSLVATGDDDSKSRTIQPRDGDIREELYQNFRYQMVKAVEQLPQDEKACYMEALERAPPQVWKEESNPDMFLRLEDFHAFFAAKRICRYWQLRSDTFGPKRFDSLYQTGEDALGNKELQVLQMNTITLLPNDAHGCPVLSIDCSRLEKRRQWVDSRDRCLFYMFSLPAEDEVSQTEGAVLLCRMDSPPFHSLDVAFLERLANSLPLRFKAVHLLSHEPIPNDVESRIHFGDETHVHVGSSNGELASRLGEFGMNKTGLPEYLNGEWGLSKFIQWQEIRTRTEWKIPLGFSGRDHSKAFELPAIRPYTLLPDEEKAERNRRLNVIHCRRKRDLKRVQVDTLEDECAKLREVREGLLGENRRLEDLVKVTMVVIDQVREEQGEELSAPNSEQGSKMLSGDKTPPVGTRESVSTTATASVSSTSVQLSLPLRREHHERTQALHEGQQEQFTGSGDDAPLQQAPAVLPASLGLTSTLEETSSPFLSSAARSENPCYLLAAHGLVELFSQSWASESPGGK